MMFISAVLSDACQDAHPGGAARDGAAGTQPSLEAHESLGDPRDEVAVDELFLSATGLA